jgi:RNA polymerase sigma-70 factor (ECF subfamily)
VNERHSSADAETSGAEQSSASIASSLLCLVRQHDQDAWRRLEYLLGPVIALWLKRGGLSDTDACDVRQEVLQAVWSHVGDFQRIADGSTFRGWVWTITRNKIHDHYRRRGRHPVSEGGTSAWLRLSQAPAPFDESESAPPPDPEELSSVVRGAIQLVQKDVQPHTWQAFWLVVVEGRTAAEAAEQLKLNVGSVYTARSRVLARIREALGPDCESLLTWR